MSKIHVAVLAGLALVAANLTGVVTASAATHSTPAAASTQHPTPAALLAMGKDSALHKAEAVPLAAAASASPAKAQRVVPHLDPQTANLPATKGGLVRVVVSGSGTAAAVKNVGGRVLATNAGTSSVAVPKSALATLAQSSGVSEVTAPEKAVDQDNPSGSGNVSGATAWNTAGLTGSTVKLAIVDGGFGSSESEYDTELGAGHLGSNPQLINDGCTDDSDTPTPFDDAHGLQTAELAHQMAPDAQLYLYCVGDNIGFNDAATALIAAGIKVASSSLGFPNDSRGDGTGPVNSVAAAVEKARKAGVLWIESAGNQAFDHWGQNMTDTDHDDIVDLGGPKNVAKQKFEDDAIFVPGSDSAEQRGESFPASAEVFLQWDQWPTTKTGVSLLLYGVQCLDAQCDQFEQIEGNGVHNSTLSVDHQSGTAPVLQLSTADFTNFSEFDQIWDVVIDVGPSGAGNARLDLNYYGEFDGPSILACPTVNAQNQCNNPAGAYAESLSAPANSPYALAVGAADAGVDGDGVTPGTPEDFSSRGPTIDGRIKPDITGWDGLNSFLSEYQPGFYGTSAAAPVVAGAAALVEGSNPTLDASQIETYLEQHANSGHPLNPPSNQLGHGLLTLGAVPPSNIAQPPVGTKYMAITPIRVYDSRPNSTPGHKAPLGAGGTTTFSLASYLPADATSVVINLTGVHATGTTYLSAYAGGATYPGTSNVNLSATDSTAAVLTPVTLGTGKTITIRNAENKADVVVDLVGYFGTGAETGLYIPNPTPTRVLDTRGSVGGHPGKLGTNQTVTVDPGALPDGTTAVAINLTAANTGTGGFFNVSPTCSTASSTLNVTKYNRANMAIVKLDGSGHFCVASGDAAPSDMIVDVLGYFGPAASGASYYALPAPVRVLDSRIGNGGQTTGRPSAIGPNAGQAIYADGVGEIPASANGLFTDVVEATATSPSSFFALYAGGTAPTTTPATSTLNFSPNRVVSNAAIAETQDSEFGIYNSTGSTQAVADVFGYFLPPPI